VVQPGETGELKVTHGVLRLADDRQRWAQRRSDQLRSQIKDIGVDALFFASIPEFLSIRRLRGRTRTDGFRLGYGSTEGLRYGAYSYLETPMPTPAARLRCRFPNRSATEFLLLPNIDPRIIQLARQVTGGLNRRAARDRHRSLSQTRLRLPPASALAPAGPLAHFLFRAAQRPLQYFASAMAVMLRVVWVPSRWSRGSRAGSSTR
jgi:transglutaminase-like putative cysteine protease